MSIERDLDLGFSYKINKNESVFIQRKDKVITTLRGGKAIEFINKIQNLSMEQEQQYLARLTGNYKRGNEKG